MQILKLLQVSGLTGISRSTIYSLMQRGHFPQSVKLTERRVGWRSTDIDDWIKSRHRSCGRVAQ
jgi:prophage regulatory protein